MSTLAEVAPLRKQTSERSACAARLIPGRSSRIYSERIGPQAVRSDGLPRQIPESVGPAHPDHGEPALQWVIPSPFAGQGLCSAILADYLVILICWMVAFTIEAAFQPALASSIGSIPRAFFTSGEAGGALLFAMLTTLLGFSEGLYTPDSSRRAPKPVILTKVIAWTTLLQGLMLCLIAKDELLSVSLVIAACLSCCALISWRAWWQPRKNPRREHNVLIVGAGRAGREVARFFAEHPESGRQVRGFLDHVPGAALRVLGPPERVAEIARAEFADEIIVALPRNSQLAQRVIWEARSHNLDVKAVPDLFGCEPWDPWVEYAGNVPLITLHREAFPAVSLFWKHAVDIVVSIAGLAFLAPFMLVIAALVRLDSKGPILYSAPRVGKRGRRFQCLKFRTMVQNAGDLKDCLRMQNQRQGPCFKIVNDPRITRVGHFLRRYSLDELPQLWNVVKGEMSLVGPRPHPVDDFSRYALDHYRRLDVTPGITGLWQVTARRNPSFQVNLALDLEYIEKWSLGLDFHILMKTLAVVFHGTGA